MPTHAYMAVIDVLIRSQAECSSMHTLTHILGEQSLVPWNFQAVLLQPWLCCDGGDLLRCTQSPPTQDYLYK